MTSWRPDRSQREQSDDEFSVSHGVEGSALGNVSASSPQNVSSPSADRISTSAFTLTVKEEAQVRGHQPAATVSRDVTDASGGCPTSEALFVPTVPQQGFDRLISVAFITVTLSRPWTNFEYSCVVFTSQIFLSSSSKLATDFWSEHRWGTFFCLSSMFSSHRARLQNVVSCLIKSFQKKIWF